VAKIANDPITAQHLAKFVDGGSDFAFEMRVVAAFRELGFQCTHSGTYRDPVTDKIRQFDVRAFKDQNASTLALAVECKNVRPNYPLLLSAVPRTADEAFHDLLFFEAHPMRQVALIRSVSAPQSVYKPGEMVGKNTDQVGRDAQGALVSGDQATFEKINQALNSCEDLVRQLVMKASPPFFRIIVPFLILPAGVLWQVEYGADGALQSPPRQIERGTLYINHGWSVDRDALVGTITYRLSHLEVVTLDALSAATDRWIRHGAGLVC